MQNKDNKIKGKGNRFQVACVAPLCRQSPAADPMACDHALSLSQLRLASLPLFHRCEEPCVAVRAHPSVPERIC